MHSLKKLGTGGSAPAQPTTMGAARAFGPGRQPCGGGDCLVLSDSFYLFLQIKKARDGIRTRPNNKKAIKFKERRRAFFVCSTVVVNHLALANPTDSFVFYTTLAQSLQRLFLCFIQLWLSHFTRLFLCFIPPWPVTPSGFKHPGQSDRLSQGK